MSNGMVLGQSAARVLVHARYPAYRPVVDSIRTVSDLRKRWLAKDEAMAQPNEHREHLARSPREFRLKGGMRKWG
jgi:hypothetical protein